MYCHRAIGAYLLVLGIQLFSSTHGEKSSDNLQPAKKYFDYSNQCYYPQQSYINNIHTFTNDEQTHPTEDISREPFTFNVNSFNQQSLSYKLLKDPLRFELETNYDKVTNYFSNSYEDFSNHFIRLLDVAAQTENANGYFAVYINKANQRAYTTNYNGILFDVYFDNNGYPYTVGWQNNRIYPGIRYSEGVPHCIHLNPQLESFILQSLHPNNDLNLPTGERPNVYDSFRNWISFQKMKDFLGYSIEEQSFNNINSDQFNIPEEFIILPFSGAKISHTSKYYNIFIDITGNAYIFSEKGQMHFVFFNKDGAPLTLNHDSLSINTGYRVINGILITSHANDKYSAVKFDRTKLIYQIQHLLSYPGTTVATSTEYPSFFITSKQIPTFTIEEHANSFTNQKPGEIFTQNKPDRKDQEKFALGRNQNDIQTSLITNSNNENFKLEEIPTKAYTKVDRYLYLTTTNPETEIEPNTNKGINKEELDKDNSLYVTTTEEIPLISLTPNKKPAEKRSNSNASVETHILIKEAPAKKIGSYGSVGRQIANKESVVKKIDSNSQIENPVSTKQTPAKESVSYNHVENQVLNKALSPNKFGNEIAVENVIQKETPIEKSTRKHVSSKDSNVVSVKKNVTPELSLRNKIGNGKNHVIKIDNIAPLSNTNYNNIKTTDKIPIADETTNKAAIIDNKASVTIQHDTKIGVDNQTGTAILVENKNATKDLVEDRIANKSGNRTTTQLIDDINNLVDEFTPVLDLANPEETILDITTKTVSQQSNNGKYISERPILNETTSNEEHLNMIEKTSNMNERDGSVNDTLLINNFEPDTRAIEGHLESQGSTKIPVLKTTMSLTKENEIPIFNRKVEDVKKTKNIYDIDDNVEATSKKDSSTQIEEIPKFENTEKDQTKVNDTTPNSQIMNEIIKNIHFPTEKNNLIPILENYTINIGSTRNPEQNLETIESVNISNNYSAQAEEPATKNVILDVSDKNNVQLETSTTLNHLISKDNSVSNKLVNETNANILNLSDNSENVQSMGKINAGTYTPKTDINLDDTVKNGEVIKINGINKTTIENQEQSPKQLITSSEPFINRTTTAPNSESSKTVPYVSKINDQDIAEYSGKEPKSLETKIESKLIIITTLPPYKFTRTTTISHAKPDMMDTQKNTDIIRTRDSNQSNGEIKNITSESSTFNIGKNLKASEEIAPVRGHGLPRDSDKIDNEKEEVIPTSPNESTTLSSIIEPTSSISDDLNNFITTIEPDTKNNINSTVQKNVTVEPNTGERTIVDLKDIVSNSVLNNLSPNNETKNATKNATIESAISPKSEENITNSLEKEINIVLSNFSKLDESSNQTNTAKNNSYLNSTEATTNNYPSSSSSKHDNTKKANIIDVETPTTDNIKEADNSYDLQKGRGVSVIDNQVHSTKSSENTSFNIQNKYDPEHLEIVKTSLNVDKPHLISENDKISNNEKETYQTRKIKIVTPNPLHHIKTTVSNIFKDDVTNSEMQPIHRDSIESKTTMLNLQKATEFKSANNLEVVDSTTKTKTVNIIHAQPNSNSENSDLYIMVPNMFVAYDSSNNFTRVFLDVIKSKPVCFDEEGDLVEVFLNDDNIPVTVEENKVNIGYVIRNGEKVFSTEKDNYSSKTLDIDHIKDQIDALGPADPSYATLHHFTDVNSLLKAAYNKLNKTNAVGLVDDTKLAKRHFSQFYIPIPSMGVLYEDEKFHSVMINKTGVPVLFPNTQTNDIVNVYFNFENLPVTIDKNGTIQKGYILVKGSPKFSTTVGDLKELTLNYTLVKEAIDSIGPSYNGYFCLHKPLNLDESIGNVLKEIDVQTSKCKNNKIINKLEHLIKLPGFGVTIDNSENTYFIYLTDDGTPVVSDPSNDNLVPIQFDLQGAPIANISNVLHHGFIEINKQPVYSVLDGEHKNYKFNNTIIEEAINLLGPEEPSYYLSINHPLALHTNLQDIFNNLTIFDANNYVSHNITYPTTGEYYVIPGFGIQLYKDSFYPVIVDSQGNTYCSDNGTLVAVLFDITNLPTAVDRDGQRLKGFIIVNSKPQYSMIIGPTKHITLNLESIKNAITNLGASFFGYSSLYPIDSNGIGTFLKQLSPDTALQYILSKVNISVPEQYIILPGFGVKLEEEEKDAYPLYISLNNGSVAAFNEIGNQFEVKFDSQMRPVVVGNKLLGGFLIFNSVPRQALTTDKLKTMEFDVNVVSKCITNWGPEYPFGYFTLHPIVDIPSDIQAILSSMDVISANGFLNESKFNLTVIPDPYVCIPGFGVKLPNGMDDYYPIFTNNSNVMSFDQNGIGYKVSFDVLNLPITIYNSIVYPGYVFVKGKYRYSVKAGKVHDLLIESQFVVESINKIGPDFIGFTSAYRPLMLNDKLYSFLDQLNVTSANELLNSPVQHKTTKKDLYMIPGMGIENPYESDTKYMPIFVDQVNSVTSFDNNGNVITVLLDIQDIPIAILSDGTKYKGFAMVKGVARFSITNSKTKIFTPDHTLITSTIDRLGETFVGFTSLHPLPDLDSILINSYLDMDIDNALGLVNKGLGLKIDDDLYLAVPAMGIQLTTSKRKGKSSSNRYFPIYVTKANGSLITFDEKRNKLEILVDDNGAPNVYGVDKVLYNGFINVNGEEVFSDGSGRLSKVPVTVDIIQQMVRKLGPKYFGFSMLRINEAQKRMHKKKSSEHNVTK